MDLSTAKVISMLALGIGSFGAGMAPLCISERARQQNPLLISSLLCFGGGVLLSTSLTHILPEAREMLGTHSELVLCVGFFLVYFVDELVHFFYGSHNSQRERISYGTETSSLLMDGEMGRRCCGAADNPRMCHVSHTAPCNKSFSGVIGLLCALLVHSFLEGLAIGLQETTSQVLLLLAAVACHKFVVGFCLGAELCASETRLGAHIMSIVLFSGGTVAGIGLGASLDTISQLKNSVAVSIMQALAAGTLLYVTVSEVLPRERARWHEQRRSAGVAQFFAVITGFTVMYFSTVYLDAD